MMYPRLDGTQRTLHYLRDVVIAQLFAIAQHQNLPLTVGQLSYICPHAALPFGDLGEGIGCRLGGLTVDLVSPDHPQVAPLDAELPAA